jgi:hypothetical protein
MLTTYEESNTNNDIVGLHARGLHIDEREEDSRAAEAETVRTQTTLTSK